MIKIKVVDSDVFNNFYVHDFLIWNHLRVQNLIWSWHLLKSKFELFKFGQMKRWSKYKLHILMSSTTLVFMSFSSKIIYSFKILFSSWNCLNFKIWMVQTKSHDKMTKIKVVYVDELYNFYVYNIFILFHLMS